MKKFCLHVLAAVFSAVMFSSCFPGLDNTGFTLPKTNGNNNIHWMIGPYPNIEKIECGFFSKDEEGNYFILLNAPDEILAKNLGVSKSEVGVTIKINESSFGQIIQNGSGAEISVFKWREDDWLENTYHIYDDFDRADVYVDIEEDGRFCVKYFWGSEYSIKYDEYTGVSFKGSLKEVDGLERIFDNCCRGWNNHPGYWVIDGEVNPTKADTYVMSLVGWIPTYVTINKVWVECDVCARGSKPSDAPMSTRNYEVSVDDLNLMLVEYEYEGYQALRVSTNIEVENLRHQGEVYNFRLMGNVSYKGVTCDRCLVYDSFTSSFVLN